MTELGNYTSIEIILSRMTEAAGRGDMRASERFYLQAVDHAALAFGADRAPFAVMCMSQAVCLQKSGQMLKAEAFNAHLRNMLMLRGGELSVENKQSTD